MKSRNALRIVDTDTAVAAARARVRAVNAPATLADVAGQDAAVARLRSDVLAPLCAMQKADSARRTQLGALMPTGVLLEGPPGCGKTLLARALAGEAGVPFLLYDASELLKPFVGQGAARVREIYANARRSAPCVVFLDEIDAVGARRGSHHDHTSFNALLSELDGVRVSAPVVTLAATNLAGLLDPALIRPRRLETVIGIAYPNAVGRGQIFALAAARYGLSSSVELDHRVAETTGGYLDPRAGLRWSGAALDTLARGLARARLAEPGRALTRQEVDAAIAQMTRGRTRVADADALAAHGAGHVVVAGLFADSAEPLDTAGDHAALDDVARDPSHPWREDSLWATLVSLMAGRAAERMLLGRLSAASRLDVGVAQRLAVLAYANLGFFGEQARCVAHPLIAPGEYSSPLLVAQVDQLAQRLVTAAEREAGSLLAARHGLVIRTQRDLRGLGSETGAEIDYT